MISVGSRDGRRGIELRSEREEMEETELEEGEACYYHNEDGDSTIDPDAPSYIDEKVQAYLGHFQKDFEGGVSAENLGAKFGGYGSFLPTYQRSPSWSHPRTPPEGGQQNSFSSSTASLSARAAVDSLNAIPVLRPPSVNDLMSQDLSLLSNHGEELTSKFELERCNNLADQKTLKFRIKVGTENLLTHKKAEIYSGLGLDVSPSSSLNDSPTDSEGLYHDLKDVPHGSPTSILQIITSVALHRRPLLSPLSDNTIQLTEREWQEKNKSKSAHRANHGNSRMVVNGFDLPMTNGKALGDKKQKLLEKSTASVEPSDSNSKDIYNGKGVILKKETEIDNIACEELVSNTLKLPLLSNSYCDAGLAKDNMISVTDFKDGVKSMVKDDSISKMPEEGPPKLFVSLENGKAKKSNRKSNSSGKFWESRKLNGVDENSDYKKESDHNEEKSDFSIKCQSNVSEEKKSLKLEDIDTSKQKVVPEVSSHNEHGLKLAPEDVQLSAGGKKKPKGSQSLVDQNMDFQEDGSTISSSLVSKCKKTSSSNINVSKSESESLKKGDGKAKDRYKEFFGDVELGQEDDEIASEEMTLLQRAKESELVRKRSMPEWNSSVKERPTGKKAEERSVSRDHPRLSSNVPRLTGRLPNPDAALPAVTPLVEEYWVQCDRCQTWRLLPLGTNPESLPEKWICSMLDWLPGMNDCSVSEEETTNALMAHYQVQASTASVSRHNQHTPSGWTSLEGSTNDGRGTAENSGLQVTVAGGKKTYGLKDVAHATNHDTFICAPNLGKNLQESTKGRSLNEANHSTSVDQFGNQHLGQANDSVVDRCGKENKKKTLVDHYADEDDTMKSKMNKENGVDGLRPFKKMKAEHGFHKDENYSPNHGIGSSKAGCSSNSGLSNSASGKDPDSYGNCSRDSKGYSKKLAVLSKKPKFQMSITSDSGSLQVANCEKGNSVKKRKANGIQNFNVKDRPLSGTGDHSQGSRVFLEESLKNDHRKEKKARIPKSDGKNSHRKKDAIVSGKKAARGAMEEQLRQDLASTPSHRSIDAADSLRRDLRSVQPPAAATSSSSKVSGSRRSKASHQEMKDSPVESVSSSPLKFSNTDKFSQARRNVEAKENFQEASFYASASPRRSVDGYYMGGSDVSGKMKDDMLDVIHNGSHESSVLDFQGGDLGHISSGKEKAEYATSPPFAAQHVPDSNVNPLEQGNENACQTELSEHTRDARRRNDNQYSSNGSHSKKSGSRFEEKTRGSRSEVDNGKIMPADSLDESSFEEKMKAGRNKFQEISGISSDRTEKNYVSKKNFVGKLNRENFKEESPLKIGGHVARADVVCVQDSKQKVLQESENERSLTKPLPDRTGIEATGREKSHSLQLSVRHQGEAMTCLQPVTESREENGEHSCGHGDVFKASKPTKKTEKQNGNQPNNMRTIPSTHKGRNVDAPSPARMDSSRQVVTNAVKEAKDLKHLADRLKNSGSTESTGFYFQAALKFLHGASLLESCVNENTKHNEMIQSMQMYSSTAKLCEFCAHEYEKSKDMASAALAYKCTEVAYMRVIYTSHTSANRDRNELQRALQIIPTGESPSSSASDIDNLNNPVTADKAVVSKVVGSPQVNGSQVLTAQNRSSFMRLINFAQDVNFAMEASRKSRTRLGEAQNREGLSSVRRALDFNFQDVDGLLRLVRVAMEAISR